MMLASPRLAFLLFLFSVAAAFGEWISIGPDGGSAHVLAIDPRNPSHLLAGSRGLLLYRSEDAGASWRVLPEFAGTQELYQAALNVVTIDPQNSLTFYAGISATNARPSAENGAGVYKSSDAGRTWTRIPGMVGVSVYCLAMWETDPHVMVAGTNRGVYRSRDSGESWEHISSAENIESQGIMSIAVDPKNADVIYAGTPHLPWKTTDGGKSWHSIHTGMSDDSDVFSIKIDQQNHERVYASACSGIYGSLSAGAQWAKFQGIPFSNRRTHVIAQDPKHPATLYAATTLGLWKSTTRGAEWRHTSEDSINAMVLDPMGVMYLAVDQRGLLRSDDGGETFHEINHGYVERSITTMQTGGGPRHPFLYASTIYDGRWGGLFRTEDASGKWDLLASEEMLHGRNLTSFAALPGTTRLVAASFDGFLRSKDDGLTWTDLASRKEPDVLQKPGLQKGKSKAPIPARPPVRPALTVSFPSPKIHINSFKVSAGRKPYLIAATSEGLFSSTNGDDWLPMKIVKDSKIKLPVSAVFVSPGDTGGLAAITPGGLWLSHDRGATWLSTAIPDRPDNIYEIAFDYVDPNMVLAATSDGIYQSLDGGKTWTFHYGGMPKGEVSSVIFHPQHHGEAYALHYGWLYRSVDGGAHWSSFDRAGLSNVTFRTISFDLSDSTAQLYGLASLRGVFVYHFAVPQPVTNVPSHPHTALN
jgi:photosystem II stability/assembly factor-like uncharacterized protein